MPPQTISLRPQTSHQARRAYQKSGGVLRLSEVEKLRLERSAELEERAAKIRAHNTRARERKRKKAEKLEKERETRKRMGMSEPTKFKINASQQSLGAFVETKPRVKGEEVPRMQVKEEKTEKPFCTDHCTSNSDPIKQPKAEQQQLRRCKPESPSQRSNPPQLPPLSSKINKANSAVLMPPPRSRAPLRKTSGNMIPQPHSRSQRTDLSTMIGHDWDSLFDSNTQVEREISGCEQDPPAQYPLPKNTPVALVKSPAPPTVPSDLLADISTQDLQYSSSPPYPAKDVSAQELNLSEEKKNKALQSSSRKFNESTVATQKRWPKSLLRGNELATLWYAIHGLYHVDLSVPDIKRLISGKYLTGVGGMVPPRLVTLMAIKVEEERLNGEPPSVPNEIMQWATSMRQREVLEERQAATVRARRNSSASKTANSNRKFARQNPGVTGPNPVSTKRGSTVTKSFDEFDDFDLSVEDLRELDV